MHLWLVLSRDRVGPFDLNLSVCLIIQIMARKIGYPHYCKTDCWAINSHWFQERHWKQPGQLRVRIYYNRNFKKIRKSIWIKYKLHVFAWHSHAHTYSTPVNFKFQITQKYCICIVFICMQSPIENNFSFTVRLQYCFICSTSLWLVKKCSCFFFNT